MQLICSHRILFHKPASKLGNTKHETALVQASPEIQTVPDWVSDTDHFKTLEDEGVIRVVEVKPRGRRAVAELAAPEAPGLQGNQPAATVLVGGGNTFGAVPSEANDEPQAPAQPDASVSINTGKTSKKN